jgi:hypothetical protein
MILCKQTFSLSLSSSFILCVEEGHLVAELVEALSYKPEGHGFDSQ